MNELKEKALAKMLEEMNKEHSPSEDHVHNWLCEQEDDELFQGILKDGYVFEPLYWLDIKAKPIEEIEYHSSLGVKKEKRRLAELQIFFEYIEANKRNLFDLCGLRGELS